MDVPRHMHKFAVSLQVEKGNQINEAGQQTDDGDNRELLVLGVQVFQFLNARKLDEEVVVSIVAFSRSVCFEHLLNTQGSNARGSVSCSDLGIDVGSI